MSDLDPLSTGEKLLNQRFLAEPCMTEAHAQEIWNSLSTDNSTSLHDTLVKCNAHLELAALEIVGVVFPHPQSMSQSQPDDEDDDNEDDDDSNEENNHKDNTKPQKKPAAHTKYLALIHKHAPTDDDHDDDTNNAMAPSKLAFCKSQLGGPVAQNHRRLILETLATQDNDKYASRSTLINLKNKLSGESCASYTLDAAEHVVDQMLQDQWLTVVTSSSKKKKRLSMQSNVTLGPRAYMELSDMLTEQFGMDPNELPQPLFYR